MEYADDGVGGVRQRISGADSAGKERPRRLREKIHFFFNKHL
jgi:hypothetical protein